MSSFADDQGIRKHLKQTGWIAPRVNQRGASTESHPVVAHYPDVLIGEVRWAKEDLGESPVPSNLGGDVVRPVVARI
jgi:hypothetical protein